MNLSSIREEILKGKLFIYPTDTVYGLGCNALDEKAVLRIKEIKARDANKPLSIIAPSFEWIEDNCVVDYDIRKYLPGAYTLLLKKKDKNFLSWVANVEILGVRIPKSNFCDKIRKVGVPFVTTSVNLSGEKPANSVSEIREEIKKQVDFVIDEGELNGKASTLIVDGKEIGR